MAPEDQRVALHAGSPSPVPRRAVVVGVLAFAAITAAGESYAKWWPYGHKVAAVLSTHAIKGTSILASAGAPGAAPSWHDAWHFAVTYGHSVWVALVAAVLIGAGVEVLVPRGTLARGLGAAEGPRSSLAGGLLALPCLMCTCCAAPITISLRRSDAPVSGALSYWLANPLLNPVVLVALAVVLPWQYLAVRVLVGSLLVFAVAPLAVRLTGRLTTPPPAGFAEAPSPAAAALGPAVRTTRRPTLGRYVKAVARLAAFILPEYFVVVLALGALRGWLLPLGQAATSWGFGAAVVAAVAGTLLVIPTAAEIPIILGLVAIGMPAVVTGSLVVALPALSLPSVAMVGRSLSWRVTTAMLAAVTVAALSAGGLVAAL